MKTFLITVALWAGCYGTCLAGVFNPITEVCWSCMFPMTIGSSSWGSNGEPNTTSTSAPACACTGTSGVRIGVTVSFREIARMNETVKDPYYFPALGTSLTNPDEGMLGGGSDGGENSDTEKSFQQVHYYIFPVWAMLQLFVDLPCVESGSFDLGYMSEVDPMWTDDTLTLLINPEALALGNAITQLSCTADAVAATVGDPIDSLFWCFGSWGNPYPLTGTTSESSALNANPTVAARMIFKMGREGALWDTGIEECSSRGVLTPFMIKSNYKFQIARPVRGSQCIPIGRPSILWGASKNPTYGVGDSKADDFLWVVSRKRLCCVGYNVTSQ